MIDCLSLRVSESTARPQVVFRSGGGLTDPYVAASRELDDLDAFTERIEALRASPLVQSIKPENFPAIKRGVLFFIWEMINDNYTDGVAKAFSALCDVTERIVLPDLSEAEWKKLGYFHRKAPGSNVGMESPEALRFLQATS